jgi:Leucine-rich repeat (LRR) protein
VPSSIAMCTKLVYLKLFLCEIHGEFSVGLRGLKSLSIPILNVLEHLSLSDNDLNGGIPDWICELVLLTHLDLEYNDFDGAIPECIGELILLLHLNLNDNYISGELPIGICDLLSLEHLEIEDTSIKGIIGRA